MKKREDVSHTTKYLIKAKFEVEGMVEKPDVVGAIFGQTEGLLGEELDLRELQHSGRIGRIDVEIHSKGGKSYGIISIPSSLDRTETSIIAAALEIVDRVGPCGAKMDLKEILDVRKDKRKEIIKRAAEILKKWEVDVSPETIEIAGQVIKKAKPGTVMKYGEGKLSMGSGVTDSKELIVVEGLADVKNVLKAGIKNAIAVDGTKVPKEVAELTKKRITTVFLDGDRGGDMILREIKQMGKIDFVARAPKGKEVEDLSKKGILQALEAKVPLKEALYITGRQVVVRGKTKSTPSTGGYKRAPAKSTRRSSGPSRSTGQRRTSSAPRPQMQRRAPVVRVVQKPKKVKLPSPIPEAIKELETSMQAKIYDAKNKELAKIAVGELVSKLNEIEKAQLLVFDGVVTQRIIDICSAKGIKMIVGHRSGSIAKKPIDIKVYQFSEVEME
jgi:DNA primase